MKTVCVSCEGVRVCVESPRVCRERARVWRRVVAGVPSRRPPWLSSAATHGNRSAPCVRCRWTRAGGRRSVQHPWPSATPAAATRAARLRQSSDGAERCARGDSRSPRATPPNCALGPRGRRSTGERRTASTACPSPKPHRPRAALAPHDLQGRAPRRRILRATPALTASRLPERRAPLANVCRVPRAAPRVGTRRYRLAALGRAARARARVGAGARGARRPPACVCVCVCARLRGSTSRSAQIVPRRARRLRRASVRARLRSSSGPRVRVGGACGGAANDAARSLRRERKRALERGGLRVSTAAASRGGGLRQRSSDVASVDDAVLARRQRLRRTPPGSPASRRRRPGTEPARANRAAGAARGGRRAMGRRDGRRVEGSAALRSRWRKRRALSLPRSIVGGGATSVSRAPRSRAVPPSVAVRLVGLRRRRRRTRRRESRPVRGRGPPHLIGCCGALPARGRGTSARAVAPAASICAIDSLVTRGALFGRRAAASAATARPASRAARGSRAMSFAVQDADEQGGAKPSRRRAAKAQRRGREGDRRWALPAAVQRATSGALVKDSTAARDRGRGRVRTTNEPPGEHALTRRRVAHIERRRSRRGGGALEHRGRRRGARGMRTSHAGRRCGRGVGARVALRRRNSSVARALAPGARARARCGDARARRKPPSAVAMRPRRMRSSGAGPRPGRRRRRREPILEAPRAARQVAAGEVVGRRRGLAPPLLRGLKSAAQRLPSDLPGPARRSRFGVRGSVGEGRF